MSNSTALEQSRQPSRVTFSLSMAAKSLQLQGIDTDVDRLAQFLNTGICWVDGFGDPRPCADGYMDSTGGRITAEGISELTRVMGLAV